MSSVVTPAQLRRVLRSLLCVMPLCWSVACGDAATQDADAAPSSAALAAAGSGGQLAPVVQMRCSLEYAACLAESPLGILKCTEAAERCGLFSAAAGAGGAPVTSPTCALRIAECVLRDPFHAQECQQMPCDAPH